MSTTTKASIPVRKVSRAEMMAELQKEISEYEQRYEMPSERMAVLIEWGEMQETAEVLNQMVFRLSRVGIPQRADPNGWQSLDRYRTIQDIHLEQNPFVLRHRDTLDFILDDVTGDLMMRGMVYCRKDVVLRVDKWFEYDADHSPLRIRCFRFA